MLTTPDEIPAPDLGGVYNFVSDIQTLAESVQDTFIKRANSYTGTSAQRVAFTASAPLGALWSDTDGDQLVWKKASGGWTSANPGVPYSNAISANPSNFVLNANSRVLKQGNSLTVSITGTALNAMGDSNYELFSLNLPVLGISSILTQTTFLGASDGGNNIYMCRVATTGIVTCVDSTLGRSGGNSANDPFEASFSLITA